MTRQIIPNRMALPPPLGLDLIDGERSVGWIAGRTIGFRGFANESDAASAARIAFRTIARRLARRPGGRPISSRIGSLALRRDGDRDLIVAGDREIATLMRPGTKSRTGENSFGFEIEIPGPIDELTMRSMSRSAYHAIRASGVRWDIRASTRRAAPALPHVTLHVEDPAMFHTSNHHWSAIDAAQPPPEVIPSGTKFVSNFLLVSLAVVAAIAVIVGAPVAVTLVLGTVFASYLAGTAVASAIAYRRRGRRDDTERERRTESAAPASRPSLADSRAPESATLDPAVGWSAIGVLSLALLVIALLVPRDLGAGFAAIGFAGLFIFRLSAMRGIRVSPDALTSAVRAGSGDPATSSLRSSTSALARP